MYKHYCNKLCENNNENNNTFYKLQNGLFCQLNNDTDIQFR